MGKLEIIATLLLVTMECRHSTAAEFNSPLLCSFDDSDSCSLQIISNWRQEGGHLLSSPEGWSQMCTPELPPGIYTIHLDLRVRASHLAVDDDNSDRDPQFFRIIIAGSTYLDPPVLHKDYDSEMDGWEEHLSVTYYSPVQFQFQFEAHVDRSIIVEIDDVVILVEEYDNYSPGANDDSSPEEDVNNSPAANYDSSPEENLHNSPTADDISTAEEDMQNAPTGGDIGSLEEDIHNSPTAEDITSQEEDSPVADDQSQRDDKAGIEVDQLQDVDDRNDFVYEMVDETPSDDDDGGVPPYLVVDPPQCECRCPPLPPLPPLLPPPQQPMPLHDDSHPVEVRPAFYSNHHFNILDEVPSEVRLEPLTDRMMDSGILLVYAMGEWGTVCNDSWTQSNTDFFCREMGHNFGGEVIRADMTIARRQKTSLSYRILLDGVRCPPGGRELEQCRFNELGVTDCTHDQDIAIKCHSSAPDAGGLPDNTYDPTQGGSLLGQPVYDPEVPGQRPMPQSVWELVQAMGEVVTAEQNQQSASSEQDNDGNHHDNNDDDDTDDADDNDDAGELHGTIAFLPIAPNVNMSEDSSPQDFPPQLSQSAPPPQGASIDLPFDQLPHGIPSMSDGPYSPPQQPPPPPSGSNPDQQPPPPPSGSDTPQQPPPPPSGSDSPQQPPPPPSGSSPPQPPPPPIGSNPPQQPPPSWSYRPQPAPLPPQPFESSPTNRDPDPRAPLAPAPVAPAAPVDPVLAESPRVPPRSPRLPPPPPVEPAILDDPGPLSSPSDTPVRPVPPQPPLPPSVEGQSEPPSPSSETGDKDIDRTPPSRPPPPPPPVSAENPPLESDSAESEGMSPRVTGERHVRPHPRPAPEEEEE